MREIEVPEKEKEEDVALFCFCVQQTHFQVKTTTRKGMMA